MKRALSLILAVLFAVSVAIFAVSCGGNVAETTKAPETSKPVQEAETTKSQLPDETTGGAASGETTSYNQQTDTSAPATTASSPDATTEATGGNPSGNVADGSGFEKRLDSQDVNFGGYEFNIVGKNSGNDSDLWGTYADLYAEPDTTNAIGKAVLERNSIVEKLYNCKINVTISSGNYSLTNADVTGNTNIYDLGSGVYPFNSTSMDFCKYYYNIYNLDLDLEQPWWDQQFMRDCTVSDSNGIKKLYYLSGAMSMSAYTVCWVMYVNLDVYEQSPITEDIFQVVRDGKWTYDKLAEMMTLAAHDSDGDQIFDANANDIIGMGSNVPIMVTHFFFSGGGTMAEVDKDGKLSYSFGTGTQSDLVDRLIALFQMPQMDMKTGYGKARENFESNRSLFLSEVFGANEAMAEVENLRQSPLPCPKYTEDAEYVTSCDNHFGTFAVPLSVKNVGLISQFLKVYAFHTYKIVWPEFLNANKYSFTGTEEAAEMVDIIFNSRRIDLGYDLAFPCTGLLAADMQAGKNVLSKMAKAQSNACKAMIDRLIGAATSGN